MTAPRLDPATIDTWLLPLVLERQAAEVGDRPYFQWEEDPAISYAELNASVNSLAHGLLAHGVGAGDSVLLLMRNSAVYVELLFALNKIGAVPALMNTAYQARQIDHLAALAGATRAIVDADLVDRVLELTWPLETVWVHGPPADPATAMVRSLEELRSGNDRNPRVPLDYRRPALYMPTSGTTGLSKLVNVTACQAYFWSECNASFLEIDADSTSMNAFPLYHGNSLTTAVFPCLVRGARAVIYESFSASRWLDRIRANDVTHTTFLGVTMDWVHQQPPTAHDKDHQLRTVWAVPLPEAKRESFMERFGLERYTIAFGSTEVAIPVAVTDATAPPGAVGRAVDEFYDVTLVDPETDLPVADGQPGELVVRPKLPWIACNGYAGDATATAASLRNAWWHTGDGLRRDADGWYHIVGRTNDAMRVKGENVSADEVEDVVGSFPGVRSCAAVAVPSGVDGGEDEILVSVVALDGASIDPAELIRHCARELPWFSVPRYVDQVDELPLSELSRVLRRQVRERGITPTTWDRVDAGVLLDRERRRLATASGAPGA